MCVWPGQPVVWTGRCWLGQCTVGTAGAVPTHYTGGGEGEGPVFNLTTIIILLQIHGVNYGRSFGARVSGQNHKLWKWKLFFEWNIFGAPVHACVELLEVEEEERKSLVWFADQQGVHGDGGGGGGGEELGCDSGGPHQLPQLATLNTPYWLISFHIFLYKISFGQNEFRKWYSKLIFCFWNQYVVKYSVWNT